MKLHETMLLHNMTCSFKLKNSKYRELNGLFRRRHGASPRVSTTSEESKSVTSIAARVTKKQSSDDEIAIFEINRRGSVVPVLRTTHDAKSTTLSRSITPCHHQERKIAVREERARLETLNELFVKLEDKRPVVKLRDRRAQLEAIEREMHHLLSLRLRRREVENREDNVEDKNRANQHLIAYHSKSALIKQRHDHTDDSWSKSTRFARDNIFLKRAVREFRSHTRHSLHASKHPISELRTKNMESHWLKSRTQTHSLADDDSWYVVFIQTYHQNQFYITHLRITHRYELRFGTKKFHDKEFGHDATSLWIDRDRQDKSSSLRRVVGWKRIADIFDLPCFSCIYVVL